MSSVIVLSDSDEAASPVIEHDRFELEINGKYHSEATNDFDLPEVPFCRDVAENSTSQSDADNDCEHDQRSSDSGDNQIERASQTANVLKKDKATLREERARRRQSLMRKKALRAIERKTSRDLKPGECLKFMEVNLDRSIGAFRGEIESALENAGIKFNVTAE